MAIFSITNNRSNATIVAPAGNSFSISTLAGDRCSSPQVFQKVNNTAYHDGSADAVAVGDTVYSDVGLTLLYNTSGVRKDYNINGGLFISLDASSKYILNPC